MRRLGIPLLLLIVATSPVAGQGFDARQFVRSVYVQLLGREPDSASLNQAARSLREGRITPDAYKAGVLASPEFFANSGSDGRGWVIALYQKALQRSPAEWEIQNWMQRLVVHQGNREPVALEFLQSAEANPPVGPRPPVAGGALPEALAQAAQGLANAIQSEVPVSMSYLIRAQAGAFLQSSRASIPALSDPVGRPWVYRNAVGELQNSLAAVRNTFAGIPGAALNTRRRLSQCEEILAALASSGAPLPPPVYPPIQPPLPPGFDNPGYEFYSRQMAELTRNTSQLVYQLRGVLGRSLTLPQLLNDCEELSAQADNLKTRLRNGMGFFEFRNEVSSLRRRVRHISYEMNVNTTPPNVTQTWYATQRIVDEITQRAGLGGGQGNGDYVVPGGPTFDLLPIQPEAENITRARIKAVGIIDNSIAQVDGILVSNNAMLFQYPNLSRYLYMMRGLRASLSALRTETTNGAGPQVLQPRLTQINADLQAAEAFYRTLGVINMQQSVQGMRNLFDLLTQLNRLFYTGQ